MEREGAMFATAGLDRLVKVWLYDEGECVAVGAGHSGAINRVRIAPDNKLIASVGDEGAIFLWRMPGAEEDEEAAADEGAAAGGAGAAAGGAGGRAAGATARGATGRGAAAPAAAAGSAAPRVAAAGKSDLTHSAAPGFGALGGPPGRAAAPLRGAATGGAGRGR